MPETRIYVIIQKGTSDADGFRLVEATSAAQAIRHCARNVYTAQAATPKDIARLMGTGVTIENATDTQTN